MSVVKKRKLPPRQAVVPVWMAEIKIYNGWTDKDLAKRLAVSERTIQKIRAHPGQTNSDNILLILELRNQAIERSKKNA